MNVAVAVALALVSVVSATVAAVLVAGAPAGWTVVAVFSLAGCVNAARRS